MGLCGVVTERVVWTPMVPNWKNVNITTKELTPIIMAAILWSHHWTGKAVLFCCYNQAIIHCIQSGSSSKEPQEGQLLRCSFLLSQHRTAPFPKYIGVDCFIWRYLQHCYEEALTIPLICECCLPLGINVKVVIETNVMVKSCYWRRQLNHASIEGPPQPNYRWGML